MTEIGKGAVGPTGSRVDVGLESRSVLVRHLGLKLRYFVTMSGQLKS
jgi:hypothetical protein